MSFTPKPDQPFKIARAQHCLYADAYALTPRAAQQLLKLRAADDSYDHEGYLLQLQELVPPVAFTVLPRLALQRWNESDIQQGGRVAAFAHFYKTVYHKKYPESLYWP